jgi:hypothetical protein
VGYARSILEIISALTNGFLTYFKPAIRLLYIDFRVSDHRSLRITLISMDAVCVTVVLLRNNSSAYGRISHMLADWLSTVVYTPERPSTFRDHLIAGEKGPT